MASHAAHMEQLSHARRMQDIVDNTVRRREKHAEHAQTAGRAVLGTEAARRRIQAEVARENKVLNRYIRTAKPRLASPSAIALLTGGKGKGGGGAPAADGDDDEADD